MTALHQQAVAFVKCACAQDTCGNFDENNDIALFIIGLIMEHQKGQLSAAQSDVIGKKAKTAPFAAEAPCVCRETAL